MPEILAGTEGHCFACERPVKAPGTHLPECLADSTDPDAVVRIVNAARQPTAKSTRLRLEFACPGCSETLRVPLSQAGKLGRCNHCKRVLRLPQSPSAAKPKVPSPQPPAIQPPAIQPPATQPPATQPPATQPPAIPASAAPLPRAAAPLPAHAAPLPAPAHSPTQAPKALPRPLPAGSTGFEVLRVGCPACHREVRVPARTLYAAKARCPGCDHLLAPPSE